MMNDWDQIKGESDQEFAKFLTYKDLGLRRTVDETYRKSGRPMAKQATNCFLNISRRNRWKERAEAYDKHIAIKASMSREQAMESIRDDTPITLAQINKKIRTCVEKGDTEAAKAMAPLIITLKKTGAFDMLVDSYKLLFGEKHEHNISGKLVKIEFD